MRGGSGLGAANTLGALEATAGPSEGQGTTASFNKESAEPLGTGAQGAGEGWECAVEASGGPSEPRRPPTAPTAPATLTEAQLAAFPEAAPARSPGYGRDLQGAGLQVRGSHGEGSRPRRQQLADASLKVAGGEDPVDKSCQFERP